MREVGIRGSIAAVITAFCIFGCGYTFQANAQEEGVAPELAAHGVWNANTTYAKDDIVTARGAAWISLKAGNKNKVPGQTKPSTATWWRVFARGFNPAGAWSNAPKYQPDDIVTYLGQSYRAKVTNQNRQPNSATNWELLAAKGDPGAAGPQGAQGVQGPPGLSTDVSAGTQSVPAISFAADADTGIFSPGAGRIALSEDGQLFLHNIGDANSAFGLQAMAANSGGVNDTAIGFQALRSNTSGADNTAVGTFALQGNTGGGSNVAVGSQALASNTFGNSNTAAGAFALFHNTDGFGHTAVGLNALFTNSTGSFNTAVGLDALGDNTIGETNTAVGVDALEKNGTGNSNTAIGFGALANNVAGSDNIAIGHNAGNGPTGPANSIFIGNIGGAADTNTIKIGLQGTQTSAFIGGIFGATSASGVGVFVNSNGQLGTATSSRRYKEDIAPFSDAHVALSKLRPVTFRYKQSEADGSKPKQYGLIAEEVEEVSRDLVAYNTQGGVETVKYHFLPPLLLAGWQAQQKTILAQTEKIELLEARIARLEAALSGTKAAALRQ